MAMRRRTTMHFGELSTPTRVAPDVPDGVDWPEPIRAWWRDIWRSPVSEEWDVLADQQAVRRLADLYAKQTDGDAPTAAFLAQIVKLEGELCLTPAARRRQHVRLPQVDDEDDAVSPPARRSARERLRVAAVDESTLEAVHRLHPEDVEYDPEDVRNRLTVADQRGMN